MPRPIKKNEKAQIEMSSTLLSTLLNSGLLHCGDCKCLNAGAKSVLWHTLLASSTSIDSSYNPNLTHTNQSNGDKTLCA